MKTLIAMRSGPTATAAAAPPVHRDLTHIDNEELSKAEAIRSVR